MKLGKGKDIQDCINAILDNSTGLWSKDKYVTALFYVAYLNHIVHLKKLRNKG